MIVVVYSLLALAAATLGLRAISVFIGPRVHTGVGLLAAMIVGAILVAAGIELAENYGLLELALGLLFSLAPVGVFDLAKWWFRRRRPV
jgi:hypothetical protein